MHPKFKEKFFIVFFVAQADIWESNLDVSHPYHMVEEEHMFKRRRTDSVPELNEMLLLN